MEFQQLSKIFFIIGFTLILIGLFLKFFKFIPFFHLPGDIVIKKDNFSFYFPIATSILLSIILSILFIFFSKK